MPIFEERVNSLAQYIVEVMASASVINGPVWYRGLRNINYKLEPSLFRAPYGIEHEIKLFNRFKVESRPYAPIDTKDDWEVYFHMQHYGVPTRLLDWSTDPICALGFALFGNFEESIDKDLIVPEHDAVVYLLDSLTLETTALEAYAVNRISLDGLVDNPNLSNHFKIKDPNTSILEVASWAKPMCIPISPPLVNDRIIAQKGTFTLFPAFKDSPDMLGMYNVDQYIIKKIIIDKDEIPTMKKNIRNMGVSKHTIFPSLESLAKVIKESIQ